MNFSITIPSPSGSATILPGGVLQRRRAEYDFAFQTNWDGRGAVSLDRQVVDLASTILQRHAEDLEPTDITPGSDGSLSFTWEDRHGNYVYCDIGPRDSVHVYHSVRGDRPWEQVSVASDAALLSQLANALDVMRPVSHNHYVPHKVSLDQGRFWSSFHAAELAGYQTIVAHAA